MTRLELLHRFISRLYPCSHDELRVLDVQLSRMEMGRAVYGPLDLAKCKRDWDAEEAAENADAAFYRACALLSKLDEESK